MAEAKPKGKFEELKSLTVLYVEDDFDTREAVKIGLGRRVRQLWMAEDGQQGLEFFRQHRPQMVVTDVKMPGMDGLDMAAAIRELDDSVPILVTTAFKEVNYLWRSLEIGIDGYLAKPLDPKRLYSVMAKFARAMHAEQMLRESEERYRSVVAALFEGVILMGADGIIRASNASAERILGLSLDRLVGQKPFGHRWQAIHEDGSPFPADTQPTWVTVQTGEPFRNVIMGIPKPDSSITWLSVNSQPLYRPGDDKPYAAVASFADITEHKRAEEKVRALQAELRAEAIRDPLTGLYNRRYLEETLKREVARAERDGHPFSIFMSDIDHFKSLNDTYGHQAGDEMLSALGSLLRGRTRKCDIACRYGGEEFVVVMPDMPLETARERAESVRQQVEELRIAFGDSLLASTISIGVSEYPRHGTTIDALISAADQALYEAKNNGHNRVCIAPAARH